MMLKDLTARDLMRTNVISVHPDEKVAAIDLIMVRKSLGGVPIVENDQVVGIVTSRDIMSSRLRTSIAGMPVESIMTKNPITVGPHDSIKKILGLMISHGIERIPVTENNTLVGLVEEETVLSAIHRKILAK
jgi:tRNA nucleotidyltransferase (CCA-adding enzyme)